MGISPPHPPFGAGAAHLGQHQELPGALQQHLWTGNEERRTEGGGLQVPKVGELGGGTSAPTHLPSPEALAQSFHLLGLQLLEQGAHLAPAGTEGSHLWGQHLPIPPRLGLGGAHPTAPSTGGQGLPSPSQGHRLPFPTPGRTVPTRCPAGRVQVRPGPRPQCSGGMRSWSWMAALTPGTKGWSSAARAAATFTATPVTVPARCLGWGHAR